MLLLPKGTPLKENLDPARLNLPDAFAKLSANSFSGYLRFESLPGSGIITYVQGKMAGAVYEGSNERFTAEHALEQIFLRGLSGNARLDIFRLSPDLAQSIHILLHGELLFQNQELKLIDIKGLLGKLKDDRLNGCLRIYTQERVALIFYRDGIPLGFFHDGSTEIETSADTSMSVARLPGAKIDVLTMQDNAKNNLEDLAKTTDLPFLWEQAKKTLIKKRTATETENRRSREQRDVEVRQEALALFQQIAKLHIGQVGIALVEKELAKVKNLKALTVDPTAPFFDDIKKGSRMLAGPSKVTAMIDEMRQGLQDLLLSESQLEEDC